jgi:DnaK suppressor protein
MKSDTLKEINKSLKSTSEHPSSEPSGDIYDQASSERDRELGLLLGDREREKLRNIEEALLRFEEGDYGVCDECGDDIPIGRLKVVPFARYCVKCKSDIEKMQAQTKRFDDERVYNEISFGDEDEG